MDLPKFRILCIDDDANTCNWIRIMLRGSKVNAALTVVHSGRQAFDLLSCVDYDLCIVEYALPDMTGVQFCSLVRHAGNKVPMLFFTAMNRGVDRQRAFAAGADEYLSKPDDLNKFVDSVVRLLNRQTPIYVPFQRFTNLPRAA